MAVTAAAAVTWCALASATEKLLALVTFRVTVPSARPRGDRTRNTYSPWSLSVTIASVSTAWWQYSELPACKRNSKAIVLICTVHTRTCKIHRKYRQGEGCLHVSCLNKRIRIKLYIVVIKTNLMYCLSVLYFVTQPVHVTGICFASSGGIQCICTAIGTCYTLG
jgi:hypothetical protein